MNKLTYGVFAASALCAVGLVAIAMPVAARDRGDTSFSISLGNVQFGYSDGYYDNDRRWHNWRDDEERDWYRQNHGQSYYQYDRESDRDQYRRDWREGRRSDWRGGRGNGGLSIILRNVQFGYYDGYYDNERRWHRWRHSGHRNWYRQNHRDSYYHIRRQRDRDQYRREWLDGRRADWRFDGRTRGDSDFSISLGNVVFGYSDGYYDNDRRWHGWRNDDERNWYERNHGRTYYQMRRDRDDHRNRRDWREGRRDDWRDDRDRE